MIVDKLISVAFLKDIDGLASYELGRAIIIDGKPYKIGHIIDGWAFKPLHNNPIITSVTEKILKKNIKAMNLGEVPNAYLQIGFESRYDSIRQPRQIYFLKFDKLSTDDADRLQGDLPSEEEFAIWFQKH